MLKKIEKKIIRGFLVLFIIFPVFPAEGKIIIPSREVHNSISEDRMRNQIEFLSDSICFGRATGSKGSSEAIFYLVRRFRQTGLLPMADGGKSYVSHFLTYAGPVGRDIIGMYPCSGNSPANGYVIVAANFDGMGVLGGSIYPGADSNASGVVAMLTLAEMFKKMSSFRKTYRKNIIFVALDAKNLNMKGAEHLWNLIETGALRDPLSGRTITKDQISLMININQIGSTLSPVKEGRPGYLLMLGRDSLPSWSRDALETVEARWKTGLDLCYDYYGSKDFTRLFYNKISDQKIFVENRVPSVMFTSGITMNNNKIWDTVDTLDMGVLKNRLILIFHFIEKMI